MDFKNLVLTAFVLIPNISYAALPLGQSPATIKLNGTEGGKVDGSSWDSTELKGKVSIIFYVAPSEKDLNKAASDAIKAANFPKDKYQSYAIINMAASSWPNFIIASKIRQSQEEFPTTIYVKDVKRKLVNQWGLADNSNDVVILDKNGKVAFSHDGKLDDQKIKEMLSAIEKNI